MRNVPKSSVVGAMELILFVGRLLLGAVNEPACDNGDCGADEDGGGDGL